MSKIMYIACTVRPSVESIEVTKETKCFYFYKSAHMEREFRLKKELHWQQVFPDFEHARLWLLQKQTAAVATASRQLESQQSKLTHVREMTTESVEQN